MRGRKGYDIFREDFANGCQDERPGMKLYSYWRSSAAYRVRIGLALKGLSAAYVPIHLVRNGGEQHHEAYRAVNPQKLLPALEVPGPDGPQILTQSLAILDYLDDIAPDPPLLPGTPLDRARIRALALAVVSDIHPLNNVRVLKYLGKTYGVSDEARLAWMRHWMAEGFAAIERLLRDDPRTGRFCHGESPTLADCCLIPQAYNARRFGLALEAFPAICRIEQACLSHPAFKTAHPDNQPDAG